MNWWSHDKMERCLKAAGFTDIYRSGFGQSMFAPMRETRLFDKTHPPISMYMEAVRPAERLVEVVPPEASQGHTLISRSTSAR